MPSNLNIFKAKNPALLLFQDGFILFIKFYQQMQNTLFKLSRTPGSICKQNKSLNKTHTEESLTTQATEEVHNIRNQSGYGKIIKNSRISGNSSLNSSMISTAEKKNRKALRDIELELKQPQSDIQTFNNKKLKYFEDKYQKRLSAYQSTKKQIIEEIREVSRSKNKGCIKNTTNVSKSKSKTKSRIRKNQGKQNKNEHFLLSRLRETVSVIRKNNIQESKASNVRDFSFEEDIEENLPKKPRVIIGIAERYRDFFIAFERLIGFEERLRQYKLLISCENKPQIIKIILKTHTNPLQLIKIDFEEYDFNFNIEKSKKQKISTQTIAQEIVQLSQKCDDFWKYTVKKKLSAKGAKQIFNLLNYDRKQMEIDLKTFVRELNFHLNKSYQTKDLYRIHKRLTPLTKGNFIFAFSQ